MPCKYVSSVLQKNNNLMKKGSKLIRVNPFFRRLYLIGQKSYHNFFKISTGSGCQAWSLYCSIWGGGPEKIWQKIKESQEKSQVCETSVLKWEVVTLSFSDILMNCYVLQVSRRRRGWTWTCSGEEVEWWDPKAGKHKGIIQDQVRVFFCMQA